MEIKPGRFYVTRDGEPAVVVSIDPNGRSKGSAGEGCAVRPIAWFEGGARIGYGAPHPEDLIEEVCHED